MIKRLLSLALLVALSQGESLSEELPVVRRLPMPASHEVEVSPPTEYLGNVTQLAEHATVIVHQPAGAPVAPPAAIEEETGLCEKLLEAPAQVLSHHAERCGDRWEWLLGSERVEVPTSLDPFPIGLLPGPERPHLLYECGEDFLAVGPLAPGIETTNGAVWRPAFWVFGEARSAVQWADYGAEPVAEWANRIDLFGQLNLTGTERVLIGLRPFDQEIGSRRRFTGVDFRDGEALDALNSDIQTLFFEGDFGELFPFLDPLDRKQLDYGFSIGRMPLLAQQGLLINEDRLDAITITRNTLFGGANRNLRMTGFYAWGSVNRNSPLAGTPNLRDRNSQLIGLLTESDFYKSTVNADVVYAAGDNESEDLITVGLSGIQRIQGHHNTYNTSLHLLASFPTTGESAVARQGELLFAQTSWTPHHREDLIYVNAFLAIDEFTSPARGTLAGGPLGQTGLLFSAPGLGHLGAPIAARTNSSAGGSIGYQYFFNDTREQIVCEVGGTHGVSGAYDDGVAAGTRYQRAIGHHWIALVDGIVAQRESANTSTSLRCEVRVKF